MKTKIFLLLFLVSYSLISEEVEKFDSKIYELIKQMTIDEKINQCQLQFEKTMLYKKGLLQKMFC